MCQLIKGTLHGLPDMCEDSLHNRRGLAARSLPSLPRLLKGHLLPHGLWDAMSQMAPPGLHEHHLCQARPGVAPGHLEGTPFAWPNQTQVSFFLSHHTPSSSFPFPQPRPGACLPVSCSDRPPQGLTPPPF